MTTAAIFTMSLTILFALIGLVLGHKSVSVDSFGESFVFRIIGAIIGGIVGTAIGFFLALFIIAIPFVVAGVTVVVVTLAILEFLHRRKLAASDARLKASFENKTKR